MRSIGRFKRIAEEEGFTKRIASRRRYWDEHMTGSIQLVPSQTDRLVLKYNPSGKKKVIYLD